MIDLPSVGPGFHFPAQELLLDVATVAAYVAATEDPFPGYRGPDAVVPPLAVLALVMRGLTDLLARFPGAIHLTQQMTARAPIPCGSTVTAGLVVRSRSERRGFAALTLDARVESAGVPVLDGSLLLMVPLALEGGSNG